MHYLLLSKATMAGGKQASYNDENDEDFFDDSIVGEELSEMLQITRQNSTTEQQPREGSEDDESSSDDDDSFLPLNQQQQQQQRRSTSTNTNNSSSQVYLLGHKYDLTLEKEERKIFERQLTWFTYRCDFPEILPYGYTTDAGWGCMLRASQMLLAQAFQRHFGSKPNKTNEKLLLSWFADVPAEVVVVSKSTTTTTSSSSGCFSIHNMVACGMKYDKLPGEWYGPTTSCHVIRDLVHLLRRNGTTTSIFRVVVAQEGAVYRDAIDHAMTQEQQQTGTTTSRNFLKDQNIVMQQQHQQQKTSSIHDPLLNPSDDETIQLEWDCSLLLLIPLRLGLKSFNESYTKSLVSTFSFPQSVGILGGSPRHALWFYGAGKTTLYGLDPHTVQPALLISSSIEQDEQYFLKHQQSCSCPNPTEMDVKRMDPSLALGFYCKDRHDFNELCKSFPAFTTTKATTLNNNKEPELFLIADKSPNYCAVSSNLLDHSDDDEEDDEIGDDHDDEYIFI